MNTTVSDNVNVPFTVVHVSDEKKQYTSEIVCYNPEQYERKLFIQMENIKLTQSPTETFNMNVQINRKIDENRYSYTTMKKKNGHRVELKYHSYCVELKFLNHLHEFSNNYKYEIVCKMLDSEKQEDTFLFSCTQLRLTDCVSTGEQFASLMNRDLTNKSKHGVLYFCIRRRLNIGKDEVCNERLNKVVSMFRNTGCDVVLKAKDGNVHAHKSILSQNSEVFRTMLSVDMKEKQSGIIDVSDIEKRVINKMLDYFYTGELGELEDMTEALFKLAHRYQLRDLCRLCEEYYTFNVKVDNDNIVEILKLTNLYELQNLNECAVNFAKRYEKDLTILPKYREYLIQSINLDNVVNMLLLAVKYGLKDVQMESFDFMKDNYNKMMENQDFLNMFESNARLMKEFYIYMHEKKL